MKNQYFFDLISNIAISSKSNGEGYYFYSFEKLFFLGAWVLNNFISGNFFQKWSIFAVFRLFLHEGGQIRKIYLVGHGGKWGLRIEWNLFGHRISLGSCARSILVNYFLGCIFKIDIPFGGWTKWRSPIVLLVYPPFSMVLVFFSDTLSEKKPGTFWAKHFFHITRRREYAHSIARQKWAGG